MQNPDLDRFIEETISANISDTGKILVFPLMCGLGKSRHIRHMIQERLTVGEGMIVVTDSVDGLSRLMACAHDDADYRKFMDDLPDDEERETAEYIHANRESIAFLTKSTVKQEFTQLFRRNGKKIVMMTTQRYFQMFPEGIRDLTQGSVKRDLIIFDEKPYLNSQRTISVRNLNGIDTIIKERVHNRCREKAFLREHWTDLQTLMESLFDYYETENPNGNGKPYVVWHEPSYDFTMLDEKFLKLTEDTYRRYFPFDVRQDIRAVYQALTEGATFTSCLKSRNSKGSKYSNHFSVVFDNSRYLNDVGAKVVVFDGTGNIDPSYDLDYVQMVDCAQYVRDLHNLTVRIVNVNTSKSSLETDRQNGSKLLNLIVADIRARYGYEPVVFSHIERKDELSAKYGFRRVGYFGNLKGKNDFRNETNICQIGLNRYPEESYTLASLFNAVFTSRTVRDANGSTRTARMLKLVHPDWMVIQRETVADKTILTDLEQNIFRSAIRNPEFTGTVLYTVYAAASAGWVEMLKNRYESMGATVEVINDAKYKILSRSTQDGELSHAQRIFRWYSDQPSGRRFRRSEMLAETGISADQFKDAVKDNADLKSLFDRIRIVKGVYQVE